MKTLYFLIVLIITSSTFAQEKDFVSNSFPKFVPYFCVEEIKSNQMDSINLNNYGIEQPARWLSVDQMADKYPGWSPYNYTLNNPLRYIDPDGNFVDEFRIDRETGSIEKVGDKGGTKTDYYYIGTYDKKKEFTNEETISVDRNTSGGTINQIRFWESDKSTISVLHMPSENISGYILEPAGPSTTQSGQNKRIPSGKYSLDSYSSKKFPDNFVLFNEQVSKSRAILYHTGNTPKDTHGCNMPGMSWSTNRVDFSTKMFNTLKDYINGVGVKNINVNIFE